MTTIQNDIHWPYMYTFFGTRPRNYAYENSLQDQDREKVDADFLNETRLSDFFMSETKLNSKFRARPRRDRESWCLFLRDRDKNQLLMKKYTVYLANFC